MQTRTSAQFTSSRPHVHVLLPFNDAGTSPHYDTAAFRAELYDWFTPLGLEHSWRPVAPRTVDAVVGSLAPDSLAFNLCDGDGIDGFPGLEVVQALEDAGIAYTGADPGFYATSSSKLAMKERFRTAGVPTPPYSTALDAEALELLGFPLLLKADVAAAGDGLHRASVVADVNAALADLERLRRAMPGRTIFAERYLAGPEHSVLVVGDQALPGVEAVFESTVAPANRVLFAGHRDLEHCTYARSRCDLGQDALRAYAAVGGRGYGRVDLRLDAVGAAQVLEVNANPGLSRDEPTIAHALDAPIHTLIDAILKAT